jgi:hypothetical protein
MRLLQTVGEVAAEKNSTFMPVPVELLRFFDRGPRRLRPRAELSGRRSRITHPGRPRFR